eukprot:scaffold2438_cov69-Phaeocystis_antarctica.AAC.2
MLAAVCGGDKITNDQRKVRNRTRARRATNAQPLGSPRRTPSVHSVDDAVMLRSEFVAGALDSLKLAVEGTPGILHSTRSLRNMALQRTRGDQDVAGRRLVESLSRGVVDDDPALVDACLQATGLPSAIALPLWQQLRRVALLIELLGHDAGSSRGQVLCAVGGISTRSEPLETAAAHALWLALCGGCELDEASVTDVVAGLVDCESGAIDAVLNCFAETRRLVPEAEWKFAADISSVSLSGAKLLAQELLQNPERRVRAEARVYG